ncbi:sensor histidine kinase [Lichenifustis flavocetrariae]|uniref:Blue-light-activated histidine kinase n=1 Tax=Lichenifustis flavocetrariae TaxID=2949735 RepID=A0AA41YVQ5_9HYPH|nr:HWE histidine kinase domain-containing protein [Lichenifustis flavocetrariae]MCW6508096.1 PAS domain-containing protein [Lichenifustis flavocetrariae]
MSLVLAADNTGVWSWSPAKRKLSWDIRIASILGIEPDHQPEIEDFLSSIHADDRTPLDRLFRGIFNGEGIGEDDFEFRMRRLDDGRERWISARSRVFRDENGTVSEVIGTARDITDQKLHDIHLHMLLREITHRSKNLLAIIQAMARQTVKDSLTAEDFERRLSLRLRGLAASHELLAAQDWHGAHIEELIKGQFGDAFEQFRTRVILHGESVFVKPEAAQNIGLALNELATNAIRYGALSNQDGQVDVTWGIEESEEHDRRLRITWNEFGGPAVAPPRRQGFGRKVVERVAASALDGSVSLTFAPSGLQWSLRIPASFVLSGRPISRSEIPKFF